MMAVSSERPENFQKDLIATGMVEIAIGKVEIVIGKIEIVIEFGIMKTNISFCVSYCGSKSIRVRPVIKNVFLNII